MAETNLDSETVDLASGQMGVPGGVGETPTDDDDGKEYHRLIVRNMRRADTTAMGEAAKRAAKSQAEWLGEAIRAYIAAERSVREAERGTHHGDVLPPVSGYPLAPQFHPLSVSEAGEAFELFLKLAEVRKVKHPGRMRGVIAVDRFLRLRLGSQ